MKNHDHSSGTLSIDDIILVFVVWTMNEYCLRLIGRTIK